MDLDRYDEIKNPKDYPAGSIVLVPKKEDLDWVPESGGEYFSVGSLGCVLELSNHTASFTKSQHGAHNIFKTREQVEKASKLRRVSNAIIRACLLVDSEFDQGWNKYNYCPGFLDGWASTEWTVYKLSPAYVSTQEKARQVCTLLTAWGIKP